MSELIKPESSAHWYIPTEDGGWQAFYETPKKDGSGMKKVTLREAKLSDPPAVPSVTSILKVLPKPALDAWKIEQAILASVTLPRQPDEPLDDFVQRVIQDMDAQRDKAADFGTRIHAGVEAYFKHEEIEKDVAPYLEAFTDWCKDEVEQVHQTEFIVGSRKEGYAGRVDLDCLTKSYGKVLVDAKTQRIKTVKGVKQPTFYPEWLIQLVAYQWAYDEPRYLLSVVIDSETPGPVFVHDWPVSEYAKHMNVFRHCYEVWCFLNSYDPRKPNHD